MTSHLTIKVQSYIFGVPTNEYTVYRHIDENNWRSTSSSNIFSMQWLKLLLLLIIIIITKEEIIFDILLHQTFHYGR